MAADFSLTETLKAEPSFRIALGSCVRALRRVAEYQLSPGINNRMLELGERKECLTPAEHELLTSLVDFAEKRSIERIEAQVALKELGAYVPEAVNTA